MKVCIFDIKRFAIHDGPGIRTTVFFKGCPLECSWCHNPEGIQKDTERFTENVMLDGVKLTREVQVGRWIDVDELMNELKRDRIFMDESGGGLSFSGGEPLLQSPALIRLLELSRELNIHTTVDTSGYAAAKNMDAVAGLTDLILFDLKSMNDVKHMKYTGVSNVQILQNLERVLDGSAGVVVRIPVVEGFNDSEEDTTAILTFLRSLERLEAVDILPYHPYGTHKYRRFNRENRLNGFKTPANERIEEIRRSFYEAGFKVTMGG